MPKRLLPLIPAGLLVQQILLTAERVTIETSPGQNAACCPDCGTISHHVHSRYGRSLADLPWQVCPVALRVHARRFRCLGLVLGGKVGARLAHRLAMPTNPDTPLRMVCTAACRNGPPPTQRVFAVDDWAWRRAHRYGTMLVNLEGTAVVDLLRDRQGDTLAAWLREHPGIEVVARDRADTFPDGIWQGAPAAVQVAYRWHLLRNPGDAVQGLVDRHAPALRRAGHQSRPACVR